MHRVTINILCLVTHLVTELFRDAIPNTLMWPVLVEKVFVFIEYVLESVQPQDNQMVQAFLTQTSNPTLSKGIGVGSFVRSSNGLKACVLQHDVKTFRITPVVVMEEEPRLNAVFIAFPQHVTGLLFEPFGIR